MALRSGEGFLKVIGEVGCGKTLLCRRLLRSLQDECVTAYIPNPDMNREDLLRALMRELGLVASPVGSESWPQLQQLVLESLLRHAAEGRRVVVCIDEAQAMPLPTLETLRLLSNLETEKRKLLQLVLLGQPELDGHLQRPEIRQLLQRITYSEYLGPIPRTLIVGYLQHRLAVAALSEATDTHVFEDDAGREIAHRTAGVPRLINVLAHKGMLMAYGEGVHRVTRRHIDLAVMDTPGLQARSMDRWRYRWNVWRNICKTALGRGDRPT